MANTKYKTAKQIETEARTFGMEFVTPTINFADGKQRFLSAEKREEISKQQQQMINVDFDNFLNDIYAVESPELSEEVINLIENMYYNKPNFSLAIASGANINLKKVASLLETSKNDLTKQKLIVDQLNAQINVAALKGMVRDYYSVLLCLQNGYEGKASRSLMGNFDQLLENAVFYTGADAVDPKYTDLLNSLKTNLKQIRDYRSLPKAEEITKLSNKTINNYTNTHLKGNYSDTPSITRK